MATWQQNGNPGGLLGGIGMNNTNAPQASDVDRTMAYIRDNNDRERAGQNNMGLQLMQGLGGIKQAYDQNKEKEALSSFNQAHADAWATGDNSGLIKFAQNNPAFVAKAQQAVSGLDEQQRADVGQLAMKTNTALAQGPEAYSKFVQDNSEQFKRAGVDPEWMLQNGINNPEKLSHLTTTMAYGALGPDKMLEYQDKQTGRQLEGDRNQLTARGQDITARGQDMDNARGWAGINIQQQNTNLRRMELDDKKYDRQIANETNALKLADLQDKRQQNQQAIEQGKRDKVDAFSRANDTLDQTLDTASRVLKSPGFDKYFGVSMTKLPGVGTIPGTDAADTEALVNTLSSQGFLTSIQQMKGMGALSDAEGKKISSAIASLDSKQSDKSARAAVNTIISVTQAAKARLQKHAPDIAQTQSSLPQPPQVSQSQQQPAPQQQAGYSSLWGD